LSATALRSSRKAGSLFEKISYTWRRQSGSHCVSKVSFFRNQQHLCAGSLPSLAVWEPGFGSLFASWHKFRQQRKLTENYTCSKILNLFFWNSLIFLEPWNLHICIQDQLFVYSAKSGDLEYKILVKYPNFKAVKNKNNYLGVITWDFVHIFKKGRSCDCVANSLQNFSASPRRKIQLLRKKFGPSVNFTFWRNLGLRKTLFCPCECENNNISQELERIRGGQQVFKVWPFSARFVQNRPKFSRRIVRPLHFLFGPFLLMRPNNRPVRCNIKKLEGENWYNKTALCFFKTLVYSEMSYTHTGSDQDGGAPRQACCGGSNWLRKGKLIS
jgi:hypothetical protein